MSFVNEKCENISILTLVSWVDSQSRRWISKLDWKLRQRQYTGGITWLRIVPGHGAVKYQTYHDTNLFDITRMEIVLRGIEDHLLSVLVI